MESVRNSKDQNIHNTVWREGGLKLEHIATNIFRKDEVNHILGYNILRLDN